MGMWATGACPLYIRHDGYQGIEICIESKGLGWDDGSMVS